MIRLALLLLASCFAGPALADAPDKEMNRLAADKGCSLCHAARPPRGDAVPPPAPSWREIARRYKGQPGAEDRLVGLVLRGTGPADRHWAGRAGAVTMPRNAVEISESDARKLIRWILR
jgi:cytochrome c